MAYLVMVVGIHRCDVQEEKRARVGDVGNKETASVQGTHAELRAKSLRDGWTGFEGRGHPSETCMADRDPEGQWGHQRGPARATRLTSGARLTLSLRLLGSSGMRRLHLGEAKSPCLCGGSYGMRKWRLQA